LGMPVVVGMSAAVMAMRSVPWAGATVAPAVAMTPTQAMVARTLVFIRLFPLRSKDDRLGRRKVERMTGREKEQQSPCHFTDAFDAIEFTPGGGSCGGVSGAGNCGRYHEF
jgi:hypothetical protein